LLDFAAFYVSNVCEKNLLPGISWLGPFVCVWTWVIKIPQLVISKKSTRIC
jgi:hypothetical protein